MPPDTVIPPPFGTAAVSEVRVRFPVFASALDDVTLTAPVAEPLTPVSPVTLELEPICRKPPFAVSVTVPPVEPSVEAVTVRLVPAVRPRPWLPETSEPFWTST